MHLTAEEEAILNGEEGETKQQLLEILVGVGKVFGAEEMVPIRSAQSLRSVIYDPSVNGVGSGCQVL